MNSIYSMLSEIMLLNFLTHLQEAHELIDEVCWDKTEKTDRVLAPVILGHGNDGLLGQVRFDKLHVGVDVHKWYLGIVGMAHYARLLCDSRW